MTYNEYVELMKTMLVIDSVTNENYVTVLPQMIAYAENRIYRELDPISTWIEGVGDLTAGVRTVAAPQSIVVVQSAAVVTPAATQPDAGVRRPLQRVSIEFLNFVWPSTSVQGVPVFYAMKDEDTIILAPTPDAAYKIACNGPIRPAALSDTNQETWISTTIPEVMIAASMVFGAGWQQNFGSQADNPQSAMSWESQYNTLMASTDVQDARRKAQSTSWQPFQPEPLAKESRT